MPARSSTPSAPALSLALICGDDEFAVKERAKQLYAEWTRALGGMDHEIIDGAAAHSGEALKALSKVREALQTLPFFGSGKVVWLQNCNFLGEERAAASEDVTDTLAELAHQLKAFKWDNVRLLISAGKVDKRKVFYKALEKIGTVEVLESWSVDDKDWADQAQLCARKALRARNKEISEDAIKELIERVGMTARQLESEIEKLTLYVGNSKEIELKDVTAICARSKAARAFALGDALGARNLPALLSRLDEELWEVKLDPRKSEIGLLYGLISKVRAMILLKEMLREGWVKPETDFYRFKSQLERVPAEQLPQDKRFNPLALNPYVLFKALPQVNRYTQEELVRAMDLLLVCNQRLVSSNLDEALVLQQTLVQIVGS